ncbi:unnamed protein product [Caenorhabditis auriculariae]|uniref:FERM N-terminal domain-containing protein n=1 Tax=Caenorhabditis auriculariae TaxID=2777116 RepID=A0A8S1GRW5_9PELO|nr:unnamed protein product [Caenorhabditis auriculariae]
MPMGTGSYDVRRVETLNKATTSSATSPWSPDGVHNTIECSVGFLDGSRHVFRIPRRAVGAALLEKVFEHLELVEKDYFWSSICHCRHEGYAAEEMA